jgi:hypothetical protein
MTPPGNVRLVQVTRMLGLEPPAATEAEARSAIAARPAEFAGALFLEAADSDDVTSVESALEYLEARLAFFGAMLTSETADALRAAFRERLKAWS